MVVNPSEQEDFEYIGNYETYVVPITGKYKLEVWGAQGGNGEPFSASYNSTGGLGGYSVGTVYLTKGTVLYIYVGGQGGRPSPIPLTASSVANGGYNGGGNATQYGNGRWRWWF